MLGTKGISLTYLYLISKSFWILHKKNLTQHSDKNKNLPMNLSFEKRDHIGVTMEFKIAVLQVFGCVCWLFVFVFLTVTKWQLCAMQVLSSSSSQEEKIQLLCFGTWQWRGRRWDTFIKGCSDELVCSVFNNYSWLCSITYLVNWNLDLSSQVDGYTPCNKSQLLNKLVNIYIQTLNL